MTADVITLPNVLAQRIRGAYERTEHGRQEWIEGTLELAAALAEARAQLLQYVNRRPHSSERDAIKRVYQLVELICRALERDPDGPCMLPLRPEIDGED